MDPSKQSKVSYRDDPDAVSLHTTPGDEQYIDDAAEIPEPSFSSPPGYSETIYFDDPARIKFADGLGNISCHFSSFQSSRWNVFQKKRKMCIAGEHVQVQDPESDTNPEYLQEWIEFMARQAPTPYVVIHGTHTETKSGSDGKKTKAEVTDFRVCISMRSYLWPAYQAYNPVMMEMRTADNGQKTWRGTIFKQRAPGAKGDIEVGKAKPTLKEWCHRYCASTSKTRIFRLDRTVVGFNEEIVEQRLTELVRKTHYKGHLDISFPVADRAVDIYSHSLLNEWRLKTWIRWLFYLSFLWIFSWPILYFTTNRYKVVKAEWAFSKVDARGSRTCTKIDEIEWVQTFSPAIRQLVLDGYEDIAGNDMLERLLAHPETTTNNYSAEFQGAARAVRAVRDIARVGLNGGTRTNGFDRLLRFTDGSNDGVGWGFDT